MNIPEKDHLNEKKIVSENKINGMGSRISEISQLLGSKKDLSKAAGISQAQLYRIIKGESQPTIGPLVAMAKAANVSIEWLITGVEIGESGIHGLKEIEDAASDYIKKPLMEMAKEAANKRISEEKTSSLKKQMIKLIEISDGSIDSMTSSVVTLAMLLEATSNLTEEGAQLLIDTVKAIQAKNK